ncbi:hypothetical protein ACHAXT_003294 [Thalassiosira profunda]
MPSRCVAPLLVGVALCAPGSVAFAAQRAAQARVNPSHPHSTSLASSPLFSPGGGGDDSPGDDFAGFNPFEPGAKIPTKGGFGVLSDDERKKPTPSAPGGQVSPRQMRMKELTVDLLNRLSDEGAVAELLQSNEDFLLEQLNDVDAVLEPDSVYTPDMDRGERFRRYREVMDERIEGARAPAAKKALGALKDFVLSRE